MASKKTPEVREGDSLVIRMKIGRVIGDDDAVLVTLHLPTGPQAVLLRYLDVVKIERGNNWPEG